MKKYPFVYKVRSSIKKLEEFRKDNFLIRRIGKKIPEQIVGGTIGGTVSGGLFGAGEGLQKDKNVFIEFTKGAAAGAILSAPMSAGSAFLERYLRGVSLKNYGDVDELSKEFRDKLREEAKLYYKDYIQRIVIIKDGKIIEFSDAALEEQVYHYIKQAQKFPELVKDIKNAKFSHYARNIKIDKKPKVEIYEVYKGKNGNHLIEVFDENQNKEKIKEISKDFKLNITDKKKRRFYITKDDKINGAPNTPHLIKNQGGAGSTNTIITDVPENVNPNQTKNGAPNTPHPITIPAGEGSTNTIITGVPEFVNSNQTINGAPNTPPPITSPGGEGSTSTIITDVPENVNPEAENVELLKLHIEKNVDKNGNPTGGAAPIESEIPCRNDYEKELVKKLAAEYDEDYLEIIEEAKRGIARIDPNSTLIPRFEKSHKTCRRKYVERGLVQYRMQAEKQARLRELRNSRPQKSRAEMAAEFEDYFRNVLDDFIIRMGFEMHDYT